MKKEMRLLQVSLLCSLVLVHSFSPVASARRQRHHAKEVEAEEKVFDDFDPLDEDNRPNWITTMTRRPKKRHHWAMTTKRMKKHKKWTTKRPKRRPIWSMTTTKRPKKSPRFVDSWTTVTTKQPKRRPIWSMTTKRPKKRSRLTTFWTTATTKRPKKRPIWSITTITTKRRKKNPRLDDFWTTTKTKRPKKRPIWSMTTTKRPNKSPRLAAFWTTVTTTKRPKRRPIWSMTTTTTKRPKKSSRLDSLWTTISHKRPKKWPIWTTTMTTTTTTTKRPKRQPISTTTMTITTKRPQKKFAGYKKRCSFLNETINKRHPPCSHIRFLLCDQETETCHCDPNLNLVWDKKAVDLPFETKGPTGQYLDDLDEGQCRVSRDQLCVENLIPCVTGTTCNFSNVTVDLPDLKVTGIRYGKCVKMKKERSS